MTRPARYEGDLRLWTLIREVTRAWDHNPIAILLWGRMRKWVVGVLFFTLAISSPAYFSAIPAAQRQLAASPSLNAAFDAAHLAGFLLLTLVTLILPFVYGKWAFNQVWQRDVGLQMVDISRRERLIGILAPLIRGGLVFTLLSLTSSLAHTGLTEWSRIELGEPYLRTSASLTPFGDFSHAVMIAGSYLLNQLILCLITCTVVFRGVARCPSPDAARRFPLWQSFAILFGVLLVGLFAIGPVANKLDVYQVMVQIEQLYWARTPERWVEQFTAMGYSEETFWKLFWPVNMAYKLTIYSIELLVLYKALVWLWRRDIGIAREYLFRADDGGEGAT